MTHLRFGVMPSNGRPCSQTAFETLSPQVDHFLVLEAGTDPERKTYPDGVTYLIDSSRNMNVSRWWNTGLTWAEATAAAHGADTWDVAIINDDVELPPTWLCYIADDMRALSCIAACSGGRSSAPVIHRSPGPVDLLTRLQGFAFVLAGESGIRANENYRWYYSDDWLDWECRRLGGMVMFPGCHVIHKFPNGQVTSDIHMYNIEDAQKFKEHWGMLPW